jgi:hypothetical protein
MDWKAAVVMKNALPYQAMSSRDWNSSAMRGIAVEMMVLSRAT